jgi:glycosyltransferase involved in cell wall biosynthesis
MSSLSIVIPAFNEEGNIEASVTDALAVGARVCPRRDSLEVIVMNDASTDRTGELLERLQQDEPRLRVLTRHENRGIEASIRRLYAAATKEWIFLNSADRQWPMECLVGMAARAEEGADLVVGIRQDKRAVYSAYRQVLSHGYEWVVRALGAPVGDPGSIKLGRAEALRVPIASRGVFAEGERLVRAARQGYRVVECPVEFHSRRAGKATGARPKVVFLAALDVVRTASSLVLGWPGASVPEGEQDDADRGPFTAA